MSSQFGIKDFSYIPLHGLPPDDSSSSTNQSSLIPSNTCSGEPAVPVHDPVAPNSAGLDPGILSDYTNFTRFMGAMLQSSATAIESEEGIRAGIEAAENIVKMGIE